MASALRHGRQVLLHPLLLHAGVSVPTPRCRSHPGICVSRLVCIRSRFKNAEIHSLINATFAPRPVQCTYHVARSELCLLHKPHQINIPSRPRSSNGLILAILPNGKHAPRPLRACFRSTVPSLAGVARSWRALCTRLA